MLNPERIWNSTQLPTLPTVAVQLLEIVRNPDSEIRDVVNVMKTDPAIAAKILKAVNSTYFGFKSEIKTIERAIPLLGTTVATSLALSFLLTDDAMNRGPMVEHYGRYWRQSVVQAAAGEIVGRLREPAQASEYFLCGLLLDLGRLAMLKTIPNDYRSVLELAEETCRPLAHLEKDQLGIDHVEVGQRLMTAWKLPDGLIQGAKFHHAAAGDLFEQADNRNFQMIAGMALAAAIGDYFCSSAKGMALERMREVGAKLFDIQEEQLQAILVQVEEQCQKAGEMLRISMSDLGSPSELMVQANEQLVQLTLREHVANTQATLRQHVAEREKEELQTRNLELQQQALHDPLTQLYNRQFFDEMLAREVSRTVRAAEMLGLLFIDVDHFKKLNDTYGHPFGDQVLRRISRIFAATIRSADTLARYGGEEFVVLVSEPSEKGILRLGERIRQQIEKEVFDFEGQPVAVTVSIGAANGIPKRNETSIGERLLSVADECLYEAKKSGRNRCVVRSIVDECDRQLQQLVMQHRFTRWLVRKGLLDVPGASRVLVELPKPEPVRVGQLALDAGFLTEEEIKAVIGHQERGGERFCATAVTLGLMTGGQVVHVLAMQQEDPKQVTQVIARLGLMAPHDCAAALQEYFQTMVPAPSRRVVATA